MQKILVQFYYILQVNDMFFKNSSLTTKESNWKILVQRPILSQLLCVNGATSSFLKQDDLPYSERDSSKIEIYLLACNMVFYNLLYFDL